MRLLHRLSLLVLPALVLALWAWQSPQVYPDVPNRTFSSGEFLKFNIHYGIINAGYASLHVSDTLTHVKGRPCHHIVGLGWTNSAWDLVFKVRDRYETYLDQQYLIPWKFRRYIREGKFDTWREIQFRHSQRKAIYLDHGWKETRYSVPANIHDVLSAFYFARAKYDHQQLRPGDRISLKNFLDRKTFDLEAVVVKREQIKVNGQKFRAVKFDLLIEEAGLMTDGSEIQFWISDDANKLPLRIESKLMIGSLKADLMEWDHLRHPFSARVTSKR